MDDHNIYFIPDSCFDADRVIIEGIQLRYIRSVLRKKIGEQIILTDGQGHRYQATIVTSGRKSMTARIMGKRLIPRDRSVELSLGFVPVKGLRNDNIIEKGTELGVTGFIAFSSERSVVRNIGMQKIERWKKIAQSAMTQSQQYYLPNLRYVSGLGEMITLFDDFDSVVVARADGQKAAPRGCHKILLIIGPEGGLSSAEKDKLNEAGAVFMSLGKTRLRSETAAIVGVTKIMNEYGLL